MKKFKISVNAIEEVYEADTKEDALEVYANDAGYNSYSEIKDMFGDEELNIIELVEGLEASGLQTVVIDENTDFNSPEFVALAKRMQSPDNPDKD